MYTIVEVQNPNTYLSVYRGFLKLKSKQKEEKIPLDQIEAIVVSNKGVILSSSLIDRCSEKNINFVISDDKYMPKSFLWTYGKHYRTTERLKAQLDTTQPMRKKLWKIIVTEKIFNQYKLLKVLEKHESLLKKFSQEVKSGDPQNIEAQAARIYWKKLFGKNFKRDFSAEGINCRSHDLI